MANEIEPSQILDECNERLDTMINHLVSTARGQGALQLGAVDFLKMRNTFRIKINEFMLQHLAAVAVMRLVNQQLLDAADAAQRERECSDG